MRKLIATIANRMGKNRPSQKDDILGVAYLTMCEASKRCPDTGYVIVCVKYAIQRYIAEDGVIRVPFSSQRKGEEVEVWPLQTEITQPTFDKLEWQECVDKICYTKEDRLIWDHLFHGYTGTEIAERLGRSTSYVSRRKHILFERFREVWDA